MDGHQPTAATPRPSVRPSCDPPALLTIFCHLIVPPLWTRKPLQPSSKPSRTTSRSAFGVNGGSRLERQSVNLEEAIVTAQWLLDNGYNIDLGLGQLNSSNLHRVGLTVHDAFDPCKNLKAAGTIFNTGYQAALRQYPEGQAFQAALSAYNTGNFIQGFENGYVHKVIDNLPDKARSPASATASMAVQPRPLVNGNKPALPYAAKAKHPDSQPASLSEVVAGSVGNAYGSDMATVMVYR
jgi:type IV secretion system protein VirB1